MVTRPVFATEDLALTPVSHHLKHLASIPPSRMFLIKKSLAHFRSRHPDRAAFDASQGDGGASLTGVSQEILEQALALQIAHGSAYDQPYGTDLFRRAVIEDYWHLEPDLGFGPGNVVATVGGRDALLKAYHAMLALGYGRQGDALVVSRVPWISYTWGPFSIGANTLLAPGDSHTGWAYTPEGLCECVTYARKRGREVAGVVITSPDNPTGRTMIPGEQAAIARQALQAGAAFVLFDWIYHYVTDDQPMDLNAFLRLFDPQERQRLIFLDGLTKSLGASNIRCGHLIAPQPMVDLIVARASHGVIPPFFSQAVAIAAYRMGFDQATRPIVEPTNRSRALLRRFLEEHDFMYILGQGYYAFISVEPWLQARGWRDSAPLGEYLAHEHGLAVVPGVYFSPFGGSWIRFSYATPPERTLAAAHRLLEGLEALR